MDKPAYANDWVVKLAQRRGHNIAVCALAAKNARRIWAMLQSGEVFRADYAQTGQPDKGNGAGTTDCQGNLK